MQSLSWYVRRLRSMNAAEIVWRVRSLLRDQADIVRIPLGILPKLPINTRTTFETFEPGYTCSPVTQNDWANAESEAMKAWLSRLTDKADRILENRLSYFDLIDVHHGEPFNWHRDHSAGIESPVRLSAMTDYRDSGKYGDCKLVWEPNRHHQFVVLARAYVATGDKKYADKVAELMSSWMDANPFGYGMNWKSVLEHGIRIINWVWTLDLLRNSNAIAAELWQQIRQSMYLAMWDGQRKFSRGSSANNHLVGEAAGVFVGACYCRDFPHADKWARSAQEVLEREIMLQTFDDGCTREHAFGYQFFVIQFFTLCLQAGEATGLFFSEDYRNRLHAMYRFLHQLCADSGSPPNMGDCDNGYVLDLGELPHQPGALLAVGAEVFDDPELEPPIAAETVFWLSGNIRHTNASAHAHARSVSFPAAGYHLLRSDRLAVFFDCADLGYGSIAAHGHADCLSLCLCVDGQSVFVDAGTYDYFTHPEWRNYFRETRAHNTAEVDDRSQSNMLGPFIWGERATAQLTEWYDDDAHTIAAGQHDGYMNLDDPVLHTRKMVLDKENDILTIDDSFEAKAPHTIRLHFHIEPGLNIRDVSNTEIEMELAEAVVSMSTAGDRICCIRADDRTKPGWVSKHYHQKQASTCLRIEKKIDGSAILRTEIKLR